MWYQHLLAVWFDLFGFSYTKNPEHPCDTALCGICLERIDLEDIPDCSTELSADLLTYVYHDACLKTTTPPRETLNI